jgi:hypothetical protein
MTHPVIDATDTAAFDKPIYPITVDRLAPPSTPSHSRLTAPANLRSNSEAGHPRFSALTRGYRRLAAILERMSQCVCPNVVSLFSGNVLGATGLHASAHAFGVTIARVVTVALDLAVSVAGCGGS